MKFAAPILALAVTAYSQNLTQVLSSNPNLSNLTSYFAPYTAQLAGLSNITLLAPSNRAFSEFLNSSSAGALTTQPDLIQAIFSYVTFTTCPIFTSTNSAPDTTFSTEHTTTSQTPPSFVLLCSQVLSQTSLVDSVLRPWEEPTSPSSPVCSRTRPSQTAPTSLAVSSTSSTDSSLFLRTFLLAQSP